MKSCSFGACWNGDCNADVGVLYGSTKMLTDYQGFVIFVLYDLYGLCVVKSECVCRVYLITHQFMASL